ncbi:MAG: phospholipase D family protein [Variovorax sp.]|nr:MAG: phospholipase D family protein [Variovorax sp.]
MHGASLGLPQPAVALIAPPIHAGYTAIACALGRSETATDARPADMARIPAPPMLRPLGPGVGPRPQEYPMPDVQDRAPARRLRRLYWQLRALLVLLAWRLRPSMARSLLRCRPGAGQLVGHVLAAVLSTGCASLPQDVQRPPSAVPADVSGTRLAQVVRASAAGEDAALSGFRLLPDGDHALDARLALARRAQMSLDVQYYLIAGDEVGRRFLRELRDAAARGVRVRLLVDDLHASGSDALLAGLAAHPNVEVRLFNPLPVRSGTPARRVLLSLHEFERVNRRMHNKLFIADASLAVVGGRNIADDYFKRGEASNFIDMDMLASGPVVRELSALFDRFWNSEQAYPARSLLRESEPTNAARLRFGSATEGLHRDLPVTPVDRYGVRSVAAQLDTGRLEQHFAPARMFADGPEKASVEDAPARDAAALEGALQAMRAARSEVLIATPYLVPGPRGLAMIQKARAKDLRVVIMTNALAATDEPLVHWGYARYRDEMVRLGVELHELSPTLGRDAMAHGEGGSSLGRLHAKLAVIDRRQVLIGSMNMDRRSMRSNTEMGLLIDSPALVAEVSQTLQRDRDTSTYRVRPRAKPSGIEWVAREADREVVHRAEPDASWALRLKLGLMSLFVAEELL